MSTIQSSPFEYHRWKATAKKTVELPYGGLLAWPGSIANRPVKFQSRVLPDVSLPNPASRYTTVMVHVFSKWSSLSSSLAIGYPRPIISSCVKCSHVDPLLQRPRILAIHVDNSSWSEDERAARFVSVGQYFKTVGYVNLFQQSTAS